MRTIGTILILVAVVGFGIWLFGRGPANPGIPTTGDSSIDATSTDSSNGGVDMYGNTGSSDDSTDYNTKG